MGHTDINAQLVLENGVRLRGNAFASLKEAVGDIVFVTNVVGYQEILTNPAFAGKIVVMTYPLIGNYGIILDDMESISSKVKALVVREKCDKPNNFRCEMELNGFLKQNGVSGLEGVDTRFIAKTIKNHGSMKAIITTEEIDENRAKEIFAAYVEPDMVSEVSAKNEYTTGNGAFHIGVLDFGVTMSFLRSLMAKDFKVTVFPATTTAESIVKSGCSGLILSNGPGLGATTETAKKTAQELIGKLPVLGIGLGMDVLAKAFGLSVKPLKYGRNGGNHPVKSLKNARVHVSSQYERYFIEDAGEDFNITFVNLSDNTIAGMRHKTLPVICCSFLPDAEDLSCGTGFVYDDFKKMIEGVYIDA